MSETIIKATPDKDVIGEVISDFENKVSSIYSAFEIFSLVAAVFRAKCTKDFNEYLEKNGIPKEGAEGTYTLKGRHIYEFQQLEKNRDEAKASQEITPISLFIMLLSEYDAYLGKLLRQLYLIKPDILEKSEKSISHANLLGYASISELKDYILEKEIEDVIRKSHVEQIEWLETRFKIPLTKDLEIWPKFVELTQRRNLFVHCDGVVSSQYIKVCTENKVELPKDLKLGDQLSIDEEYFASSVKCILEMGTKLGHVLWRVSDPGNRETSDNYLNELCFKMLKEEKYDTANTMLDFALTTLKKHASERIKRIFIINKAIALKGLGQEQAALELLKKEDWSACDKKLNMAVHILRNEYEPACKIMASSTQGELYGAEEYAYWPLFRDFRKSEIFLQTYKEIFKHEFQLPKTYSGGLLTRIVKVSEQSGKNRIFSTEIKPVLPEKSADENGKNST